MANFKLILLLILLFAVSMVINCIQYRTAKNSQLHFNSRIAKSRVEIERLQAAAQIYADSAYDLTVRQALYRDSARVAQSASKREIGKYKQTIATLRPLVANRIDSVPVLREFVAAQDSTIAGQDSLIAGLEAANQKYDITFAGIMRQKNGVIAAKDTVITILQDDRDYIAERLLKAEKKAKRRRFFNKVLTGVVVVAVGLLLVK